MTWALALFAALITVLAALAVIYVVAAVRVLASGRGSRAPRALALVPPLTPVLAWRKGDRGLAVALVATALLYLALQVVAHAR